MLRLNNFWIPDRFQGVGIIARGSIHLGGTPWIKSINKEWRKEAAQ